MRTLQKLSGINNVKPASELAETELTVAMNVDLDLEGRATRRRGLTTDTASRHANLWQSGALRLATRGAAGDLVNVDTDQVILAGLGHTPRVWFANLPGDRVLFSNGTTMGVVQADGATMLPWGVPVPATAGAPLNAIGDLYPGKYQFSITYKRDADGAESGPAYYAGTVDVVDGGVSLSGLPVLAGHKINVYLTSHFGGERFLAGSTTNALFNFSGKNSDLVIRCPTEFLRSPPAGARLVGFWRGRTLAAVGNALYASRSHSWGLFDLQRDFKHFSAPITLVHPTNAGIWVGTERELVFLAGDNFDALVRQVKMPHAVVLGSGCLVPGEQLAVGDGRGEGECMVCIAGGWIVAGLASGQLAPLTVDRYRVDPAVTEVAAAFRVVGGVPQYIAIPQ
jgi:hypothetical protein